MKLRVRSTKLGKVRFTSHRDAARLWERALRRAELPIASTEGFTPRPKISFGLALPTAAESIAEYTDLELRHDIDATDVDLATLPERLSAALPRGFDVVDVEELTIKGSLQQVVTSCTWELWSPNLTAADYQQAESLLDAAELMIERERKGKLHIDDVRPMIIDLRAADNAVSQPFTEHPVGDRLVVDLVTIGRALRPSELAELAVPEHDARDVRALRIHQWIDDDGTRREVIERDQPRHDTTSVVADALEVPV